MFQIFLQPFPREISFGKQMVNAVLSGIIVTVFLRVFSPFGFAEAPVHDLNLFASGYGIITTLIVILFACFEFAFPFLFIESKWTVGKNIFVYVVIIFLIGSANLFYTSFVTGLNVGLNNFLNFQFITLSVTIIVVASMTMIRYFRSSNFYKKDAEKVNEEIDHLNKKDDKMTINLKSENGKENLQLLLSDLLYIEAADNYSKIIYKNDNKIKMTLIRSSLKRMEDQLTQPEIFRCHRTFIVQLRNVEKVSGNSQGYHLFLKNINESIPVSRKAGEKLHNRLNSLN